MVTVVQVPVPATPAWLLTLLLPLSILHKVCHPALAQQPQNQAPTVSGSYSRTRTTYALVQKLTWLHSASLLPVLVVLRLHLQWSCGRSLRAPLTLQVEPTSHFTFDCKCRTALLLDFHPPARPTSPGSVHNCGCGCGGRPSLLLPVTVQSASPSACMMTDLPECILIGLPVCGVWTQTPPRGRNHGPPVNRSVATRHSCPLGTLALPLAALPPPLLHLLLLSLASCLLTTR